VNKVALFKQCRGSEKNLPTTLTDGYAYFCTDTGNFYIDHKNASGALVRSKISAHYADKLRYESDDVEIVIEPSVILTDDNYETKIGVVTTISSGLMSAEDKEKLDGIAKGATNTVVDAALSGTSTNPVQNKVLAEALDDKLDTENPTGTGVMSMNGDAWFSGSVKVGGANKDDTAAKTLATTDVVTASENGLMATVDKTKLDGIAEGATKNALVIKVWTSADIS